MTLQGLSQISKQRGTFYRTEIRGGQSRVKERVSMSSASGQVSALLTAPKANLLHPAGGASGSILLSFPLNLPPSTERWELNYWASPHVPFNLSYNDWLSCVTLAITFGSVASVGAMGGRSWHLLQSPSVVPSCWRKAPVEKYNLLFDVRQNSYQFWDVQSVRMEKKQKKSVSPSHPHRFC